eukprot:GILJ01021306.1.p1 GENE.GILJ01021306.1~~GILJ01021306.1.p1  ORF type:complete len:799 (-),score=88.78 GILJ01021306.1:48-2444(-)
MYQYSLEWFTNLFVLSIKESEPNMQVEQRCNNLINYFRLLLYRNICRSLFEKDKLLFSFTMCIKILQGHNEVDHAEWRYLLTGIATVDNVTAPNTLSWLPERAWTELVQMSRIAAFKGIHEDVVKHSEQWHVVYNAAEPSKAPLPGAWNKLNAFQKLLILRCLRPENIVPAVMDFVSGKLGRSFIEPPPFSLEASYKDSNPTTALIFILSPGDDPVSNLTKLADNMNKRLFSISLGQGQGPIAEKAIREGMDKGTWVLLQNCHLAVSWMRDLETITENIQLDLTHEHFRLWLTSMPSKHFPVSVLQNGVKMTNEPPKGMRAILTRSYATLDKEFFNSHSKPGVWKAMFCGLAFFHAVIRERRKFGPLGWNIPYEFNDSDLRISMKQLHMMLDQYDNVPYKALTYLAGECNYGGRVTDDWDRRTLMFLLSDFYCKEIVEENYKFCPLDIFYVPPEGTLDTYLSYFQQLPLTDNPNVFGLHDNANITCARNETYTLFETILSLQPRQSGSGGQSTDEVLDALAGDILQRVPEIFDITKAVEKYPVVYTESMNTVLVQELIRFNRLLVVIRSSLLNIQKALKGLMVITGEMEDMGNQLFNNQVPYLWSAKAYPSRKPLGSWITDLLKRLEMLQHWLSNGPPATFWISGFFFTQSFLTGTLQNFARKYTLPIDTLIFDFEVMPEGNAFNVAPPDGCFVFGLFLEGARWNSQSKSIAESESKKLFTEIPLIWLKPREKHKPVKEVKRTNYVYRCPVYKTSTRAGTLSTTGHSTNYVMTVLLPSYEPEKHWTKRGVALLTQLDD